MEHCLNLVFSANFTFYRGFFQEEYGFLRSEQNGILTAIVVAAVSWSGEGV